MLLILIRFSYPSSFKNRSINIPRFNGITQKFIRYILIKVNIFIALKVFSKKGQVLTWDLIFASSIFLIVIALVIYMWDTTTTEILSSERIYDMDWTSNRVSEKLVRTPGYPENWTPTDVKVFGLAETTQMPMTESRESMERIIDPDKFLYFLDMAQSNYVNAREILLGGSKYDFYLEISCLNSSRTDCFDGLYLNSIRNKVSCANGFEFTVTNNRTDAYTWVEAEDSDYWNNKKGDICSGVLCSNGNTSQVYMDPRNKTIYLTPGTYDIWVRSYDDVNDRHYQLIVNGKASGIFGNHANGLNWERIDTYDINDKIILSFYNTTYDTRIDALLITTNLNYDPNSRNLPYGNPRVITTCITGRYEDTKYISDMVSNTKTATFSEKIDTVKIFEGGSILMEKTIRMNLALWERSATAPEFTTTTTVSTTTTTIISPTTTTTVPSPLTSCADRYTSTNTGTLSPTTDWQILSGFLTSRSDTNRYNFSVTTTGRYEFSHCPADGGSDSYDSYLCLFDSVGNRIAFSDDACDGYNAKITYDITSPGTYYIQVSGYGIDYGFYTMAYRRTP